MFPFKATLEEINKDPENYVDSIFSCLESEFLVMPKGAGFVEYPAFEGGYEALKTATNGFSVLDPVNIYPGLEPPMPCCCMSDSLADLLPVIVIR